MKILCLLTLVQTCNLVYVFDIVVFVFVLIIHLFGMSVGHHFLTKLHNPVSSRPSLSLSSVSLHPSDLMV